MNQSPLQDYTHQLQRLMQLAGVSSFKALSRKAGVSERQVMRLRRGQVMQMLLENILKLSQALQVPVSELLATFGKSQINWTTGSPETSPALQQEYKRLLEQMEEQRQSLMQEFVQSSLEVLESWLIQWPTAAYAAGQNPQLPAVKLLPLLRPVEQLVQQWGVEAIAPVGAELPYDPHQHQLMDLTAQPGDRIKVRYTGYRQGDRLLYRAKVSPIQPIGRS
ncbi:helix-turn-helix domain-containing protein [Argonema galeatum]|uniref:helix-turn-helix domain-containing protein n=1 Tax=Argonema galeatum TaxID=2942762 RepID=UPI002013527D|nr:helix-turn-helix domain-containing protein [Argonema galeatum]MCL1464838.1 helix-turn-helix domain-containing protein [Argonema galeatum A003/A1]